MSTKRALILATLLVVAFSPTHAKAQIFGRGARTEFISGFGIRAFANFSEMRSLLADGERIADPLDRQAHTRIAPISVVYGLRSDLSLVAIFPFVDKKLTSDAPDAPTLASGAGLGDAIFEVKWQLYRRDRGRGTFRVATQFGVKAPTGSDRLRSSEGDLLPPPLQRGSGSWDPTADLMFTYAPSAGRWMFGGDIGYSLTTEANDFEFGDLLVYDGMLKYRVHPARYPGRDTFFLLEVNGRWRQRSVADGVEVFDSGGHVLYLSPGVQFLLKPNLILEGGVQLPVFRHLNGTQLGSDINVLVGLRYIIVP